MPIAVELIDGTVKDTERVLAGLTKDLFPQALLILNDETLPVQFSLFVDDVVPTNQRNLTDVRTRMGVLLEYELGKAITHLLPEEARKKLSLTYVIANRFPDLAFRGFDGSIGARFEVKAIEAIADEKAANFDTLIKDIRKGTDFVVVMLWEWQKHHTRALRFPYVYNIYVMDAYQLAQMRDCKWLNTPPSDVGDGRQGYDLCFGVNCKEGDYNKEEGNYGKLMRIFEQSFERYLPQEVRKGTTLTTYYTFRADTIQFGLEVICNEVADVFLRGENGTKRKLSSGLPVAFLAERGSSRLLIAGDMRMVRKREGVELMWQHGVPRAVFFNGKFSWKAVDHQWTELHSRRKPLAAKEWVGQY